ncbi:MAG: aldehyde dehydrogenase family protein, partial [Acidimicrobiales bacterium]
MIDKTNFYINGQWVTPEGAGTLAVINPATEAAYAQISLGTATHADQAVMAARSAFASWSQTSKEERRDLLAALVDIYKSRAGEMAEAISTEMGAPMSLATRAQAGSGIGHLLSFVSVLENFEFTEIPDPDAPEH